MIHRMILFDLDGTLLTSNNTVSPETESTIKFCKLKGYYIGFITARSRSKKNLCLLNGLPYDFIAFYNGAEIYAENQANQVKQEIRKELVDLVNDVFDEHFGFTRKENKNVPNADLNLDRRHMRFVAIIDENKRIYRGNYVGQ